MERKWKANEIILYGYGGKTIGFIQPIILYGYIVVKPSGNYQPIYMIWIYWWQGHWAYIIDYVFIKFITIP